MRALGLTFLIDEKEMSSVLTNVYCPPNINMATFRKRLHDNAIIIYEGKGCFKNRMFQVGNIGELSYADLQYFLDTLKNILQDTQPVKIKEHTLINDQFPLPAIYEGSS